eukprot:gene18268-23943_t
MKSLIHKENQIWLDGKISGAIYHGIESHQQLLNQAFGFYSISNPLHPDIWPSVMKYESEIIAMTASLVSNGLDTVCGSTTSGGTESIILAIKSHRDYYCKKYNIKHPELICSISAHAAVDKACDLMDWSGGLYTTPTIAGSRSGGLIAQCWASLVALGEENYLIYTKDILDTTRYIADGISRIPGLKVIGNAEVMIVCFVGVDGINVYSVADKMAKKGWQLNSHQHPACVHICCTVCHIHKADDLLADLKESVEDVRSDPLANKGGNAAIYGMTSSLPNGPVNELLKIYNDVVLDI